MMVHGENAKKWGHASKEYGGRRPGPQAPSKANKKITHRLERARRRRVVRQIMKGQAIDDGTACREV